MCFDKQKMKDDVSYLLSNCCFSVGVKLFCQVIGMPMGSVSYQFFANLFSYYYETRWVNEMKKKDLFRARRIGNFSVSLKT